MDINLIPDRTAIIQLGIFLVVLSGMALLVFKPIQKVILTRKKMTEDMLNEATAIKERLRKDIEEYEQRMEEARAAALREKEKIKQAGLDEDSKIREMARKEAASIIVAAKENIDRAKNKAFDDISKEIPKIAEEIMKKVIK